MTAAQLMSRAETVALEREIVQTHLSRRDFHKASQFISAATACDNNVVREALLISALVCYTRPFSQNEGQREAGMAAAANRDGKFGPPEASRPLHDRLIVLRGKTVMEEDADAYPIQLEPSRRGKASKVLFTPHRFRSRTWSLLKENIDLHAFSQLADDMHGRCSDRLAELSDQLAEARPFFAGTDLS
jgi:hypothetical protein